MADSSMPDALTRPFIEGLQDGVLRFQRCGACGAAQTLARYACMRCGSANLLWQDASGRGTVFARTQVARAPSETFRAMAPYPLLLVDLDEGFRLMGQGSQGAQDGPGLAIGQRVRAEVVRDPAGTRIVFHPLGQQTSP